MQADAPAAAPRRAAPAAKAPLSQGAGGTGFTQGQLAVLRQQIMAFRSLKVGGLRLASRPCMACSVPVEALAAIRVCSAVLKQFA